LGDVIKESVEIGYSWIKSNTKKLGIEFEFDKFDIHVHFPEGSTPKDGPSAGITIVCCLVSLLKGIVIDPLTAMTGEICLRGDVLPVGGVKVKVMAAKRSGITRVLIPIKNLVDLKDSKIDIEVIGVKSIDEVLLHMGLLDLGKIRIEARL
jgi:ATP-dependent Lon protease